MSRDNECRQITDFQPPSNQGQPLQSSQPEPKQTTDTNIARFGSSVRPGDSFYVTLHKSLVSRGQNFNKMLQPTIKGLSGLFRTINISWPDQNNETVEPLYDCIARQMAGACNYFQFIPIMRSQYLVGEVNWAEMSFNVVIKDNLPNSHGVLIEVGRSYGVTSDDSCRTTGYRDPFFNIQKIEFDGMSQRWVAINQYCERIPIDWLC